MTMKGRFCEVVLSHKLLGSTEFDKETSSRNYVKKYRHSRWKSREKGQKNRENFIVVSLKVELLELGSQSEKILKTDANLFKTT